MTYTINFDRKAAEQAMLRIWGAYDRTEVCFAEKDLPRNIRNACAYTAEVAALRLYGADVDATGIYNDNGYDRIGYGRINDYEFIKNGILDVEKLSAALLELAEGHIDDDNDEGSTEQ